MGNGDGLIYEKSWHEALHFVVLWRMGETVAEGWGDLDWSALARFTIERG